MRRRCELLPHRAAREQAMRACTGVSPDTWRRARGWAVWFGIVMLDAGIVDDPGMAAIAERAFGRLMDGP